MKKLVFNVGEEMIKTLTGLDGKPGEVHKALKIMLAQVVNQAPYSNENARQWTNIGNKLDQTKEEVILEDAEYATLNALYKDGVDKALSTMGTRFWRQELDRILNSAEDLK